MPSQINTRHEMLRAGYERKGQSNCKKCDAPMEGWKTTNGKMLPINADGGNDWMQTVPHWATCPSAKDFKGVPESKAAPAPPVAKTDHRIMQRRETAVRAMRERAGARVVVMVDDIGTIASWDPAVPGEDLRHDLISAGNFIRNETAKGDKTL
jgi:hypothetical protein